ncbi:putative E3 ubiquitin-protein ligase RNF217 [Trifolium repens]|nr:putative E3 ubiquitin-protein ligase RNF217 [Trifolium repens]
MSSSPISLSANGKQNSMKKASTTSTSQGQSPKSLCGICLDSVINSKIFTNGSCNHPFCTKCISKYVKVKRKEKVAKVNCPHPNCSVELKPQHLRSILSKNIIVDWESAIYESSIPLRKKIYCPYKNCSLLMVNNGAEKVTSCECPSCHRLFCAQCKVPWHANINCRKFQKLKKVSDKEQQLDMKFLELAKRKEWQKCPRCSMHVEKAEGCSHMTCRCGCYFCYRCGGDISSGHICKHITIEG